MASNIHFGYYKDATHVKYLLALKTAKLSFATKSRISINRWGATLTFLFEKVLGNICIDKIRAICLLDANYNWLNKLIFTKQIMD